MPSVIDENTQFFDQSSGAPINAGYIYIGTVGLNPQTNAIIIYSDRGLTTPIANPQRTGADGRAENKIWIPGKYSIEVEDSANVQKYIELDNGSVESLLVSSNDTTPGYLNGKLAAGTGVFLTEGSDGGDETLAISTDTLVSRANPANSIINTTELSESEISITIPSNWNTYDVEAQVSAVVVETGTSAGDTNMTLRLREGSGTGGGVFGFMQGIVGINAGVDNILPLPFSGYLEGETATGSITWTLTSQASANSGLYELQNIRWQVRVYRVT